MWVLHVAKEVRPVKFIQHHFNSLHMFCKLRALGVSKTTAIRVCRAWERIVHPYLYRRELARKIA